jgi:hypothetical protein
MVKTEQFGKDHWSLLAYAEACCVDAKGALDGSRMRCNEKTHPLLARNVLAWREDWGTKLLGYSKEEDLEKKAALHLKGHDDWDCLDDLADAGFVEIISLVNGRVEMTDLGKKVSARLRHYKMTGGMYASFGEVFQKEFSLS